MKISFFLILLCFFTSPSFAESKIQTLDFKLLDKREPASVVYKVDNRLVALGYKFYQIKDLETGLGGSGPHNLGGFPILAKKISEDRLVVLSVNHDAKGVGNILSSDKRQTILSVIEIKSKLPRVIKENIIKERRPFALAVDGEKIAVLVGSERGGYRIKIFKDSLKEIASRSFGQGGPADLEVLPSGNYAVLGFEDNMPKYWEFTPGLEQVRAEIIGHSSKSPSNMDAKMKLLVSENDVFAAYGWDISGLKDERSDEVHLLKISGDKAGWEKGKVLPYYVHMEFFLGEGKGPIVVYPRVSGLSTVSYNSITGKEKLSSFKRPLEPQECFPPNIYYSVIGFIPTDKGKNYLFVTSRPLGGADGCVSYAELND